MHTRAIKVFCFTFFILFAGFMMSGCNRVDDGGYKPEIQPLPKPWDAYAAMEIPGDNPMTPEKVALGRQLFFDERLSVDGSRSCYSCHVCEKGLTDGLPKAVGVNNQTLARSSPTLWNIGYHKEYYWDGRSISLEKQAMAAWKAKNMGAEGKEQEIVAKINALAGYRAQFKKVFNSDATAENIMMAIAAYERTIIANDTAWDKFRAGNESAMSDEAKRGWQVFQDLKCNDCHDGVLLTDQRYHNVGIGMDKPEPDVGRFKQTQNPEDTGAFKTPMLRDVAKSAPYFHDGSIATLEEAVDFMVGGGKDNQYKDKNLKKNEITKEQRADLIAFLKSLSVEDCKIIKPALPQK
ncbi:MAG: cytochrome c peroxidase [Acidobacteriota bacterium]